MTKSRGVIKHLLSLAVFAGGALALMGTWWVLFWWISLRTEALLVPWDWSKELPPRGSLARTLNEFFNASPGMHLPGLVLILASGVIMAVRTVRAARWTWMPLVFALLNLLFLTLDVAVVTNVAYTLTERLVPLPPGVSFDPGYHRTLIGILMHTAWWTLLLILLAKGRLP